MLESSAPRRARNERYHLNMLIFAAVTGGPDGVYGPGLAGPSSRAMRLYIWARTGDSRSIGFVFIIMILVGFARLLVATILRLTRHIIMSCV